MPKFVKSYPQPRAEGSSADTKCSQPAYRERAERASWYYKAIYLIFVSIAQLTLYIMVYISHISWALGYIVRFYTYFLRVIKLITWATLGPRAAICRPLIYSIVFQYVSNFAILQVRHNKIVT